jgi:predicted transcriptional regulator
MKTREKVLDSLRRIGSGGAVAADIVLWSGVPKRTVSYHLSKLEGEGVVERVPGPLAANGSFFLVFWRLMPEM